MPDLGRIPGGQVITAGVQVRLVWTLANTKTAYNVLHGSVAAGFASTTTVAQAVFAAILAAAGWTNWRPHISTLNSFAGVDIRDMRGLNNPIAASTGGAVAGTGAGGALPPGDALVVTLRTALAGRANRGRVYLPGLDQSAMAAGGVAAAGTMTDAAGFITAVQTAMNGQGIALGIGNPERNLYTGTTGAVHAHRPSGIVPVTSITVRNAIIDHQRRRAGRS